MEAAARAVADKAPAGDTGALRLKAICAPNAAAPHTTGGTSGPRGAPSASPERTRSPFSVAQELHSGSSRFVLRIIWPRCQADPLIANKADSCRISRFQQVTQWDFVAVLPIRPSHLDWQHVARGSRARRVSSGRKLTRAARARPVTYVSTAPDHLRHPRLKAPQTSRRAFRPSSHIPVSAGRE